MSFQTPITIAKTLERVHRHDFVLPAIQREFVWKAPPICCLFDSLMRGYPIGSFLFWQVDRECVHDYKYYDFVLNYHERNAPHCPPLGSPPDGPILAILDGQQRLTALNIGLRGSLAEKEPRKWWDNPDAFPEKRLHLNLAAPAEENEQGMQYDFRFLTRERAAHRDPSHFWFPVEAILGMDAGPMLFKYVADHDLVGTDAFDTLYRLRRVVCDDPLISYYLEEDQDLDKVLNIFIRVNSGGTVLSYSDLLLSIATAQWDRLDARKAIHGLVDELNGTRQGFNLSKDWVLKAGLMLSDVASVGFKVTNFNQENMLRLEEDWPSIAGALKLTVRLAADFGFSGRTLGADSALLPIAYYLYHRGLADNYLTDDSARSDREAIRSWLIRSLLKSGVWGSGLDVTLTALRATLQEHGRSQFPIAEIEATMARRGRSLRFEPEEIEDLAELGISDRRLFGVLALLYPYVDTRNQFHIDHIYPQSRFRKASLREAAITETDLDLMAFHADRLPNLQLLEGTVNLAKRAALPADWIVDHFRPDETELYLRQHDIDEMPGGLSQFEHFYEKRRSRLSDRLRKLLGGPVQVDETDP